MNLEGRKAGKNLQYSALTKRVIASAIAVHRELGPGFLEGIYEEPLAFEFTASGLFFERQKSVPLVYRNHPIGEHRLDFLVERTVIVELKAAKNLEDVHFAIVRSYLKACGLDAALLFNFAAMPLTIRRVGREHTYYDEPHSLRQDPDDL